MGADGGDETLARYYDVRIGLARSLASLMRHLPPMPDEYLNNTV